ncbi:TetR/AcrR family transcriptional regulator [Thermocatellispora tengchongensis]|uniref:TetR/AcrR family transcriptional regulator n=1 Tax=Thermocatellispora tengchongensis TaxID=1073253 RepID=UPI003645C0FF
MRKDAERNRARIVAAAREVFSDRGLEAPLEEIARRAGVNIATLYRRFPDRAALVEAILTEKMTAFAEAAERALAAEDPWEGFSACVEDICAMQAADQGVTEAFTTCFPSSAGLEEPRARALGALGALVARARDAGALRADFTVQDLLLFLMANAGVLRATRDAAPDAWRRLVGFLLSACRAEAAGTLLPPAPTADELHQAMLAVHPFK